MDHVILRSAPYITLTVRDGSCDQNDQGLCSGAKEHDAMVQSTYNEDLPKKNIPENAKVKNRI